MKTYIFCFSAVQLLAKMLGALLVDMLCFASTVLRVLMYVVNRGLIKQRWLV